MGNQGEPLRSDLIFANPVLSGAPRPHSPAQATVHAPIRPSRRRCRAPIYQHDLGEIASVTLRFLSHSCHYMASLHSRRLYLHKPPNRLVDTRPRIASLVIVSCGIVVGWDGLGCTPEPRTPCASTSPRPATEP